MYISMFGQWRWMKIASQAGGAFTAVFYTAMTAVVFAILTPTRHQTWLERQASSVHLDVTPGVAQSSVGLAIDLYILILPIIAIANSMIPLHRKIEAAIIFLSAIL